ncbi:hypothetical protein QBC38DRAFT_447748 [Podospora fimiseda]|uniref:Uncharacterized protein n=1 Tax=Podospora fimiseda TaxID=252190 RepID=A0AAN7BG23_9PEZI|nr:hypothetical protein QBC38DRAFT_447748 [Podospora fimiseda]
MKKSSTRMRWFTSIPKEYSKLRLVSKDMSRQARDALCHYNKLNYFPFSRYKPTPEIAALSPAPEKSVPDHARNLIFPLVRQARILGIAADNCAVVVKHGVPFINILRSGISLLLRDFSVNQVGVPRGIELWSWDHRHEHYELQKSNPSDCFLNLNCKTLIVKQRLGTWGHIGVADETYDNIDFHSLVPQTSAFWDLCTWHGYYYQLKMPNLSNLVFELHDDTLFDLRSWAQLSRNIAPLLPNCRVVATLLNEYPNVPARRAFKDRDSQDVPLKPILWDLMPLQNAEDFVWNPNEPKLTGKPWDIWIWTKKDIQNWDDLREVNPNRPGKGRRRRNLSDDWVGLRRKETYTAEFDNTVTFNASSQNEHFANSTPHFFKRYIEMCRKVIQNTGDNCAEESDSEQDLKVNYPASAHPPAVHNAHWAGSTQSSSDSGDLARRYDERKLKAVQDPNVWVHFAWYYHVP